MGLFGILNELVVLEAELVRDLLRQAGRPSTAINHGDDAHDVVGIRRSIGSLNE